MSGRARRARQGPRCCRMRDSTDNRTSRMSIVLIGYRGSGKTTIGRKLADRLWQTFVDTDERIVARAGKSIREIFDQHGEAHFRQIEREVVGEAAKLVDHVIALGGGAPAHAENRK